MRRKSHNVFQIFLLFLCHVTTHPCPTRAAIVGVVEIGITNPPSKKANIGDWRYVLTVEQALNLAKVEFEPVADLSKMGNCRVLLFPYNKFLSDADKEAIQQFTVTGGKTVWFYLCPDAIAASLGFRLKELVGDLDRKKFKQVRLDTNLLPGAPVVMQQDSWNIHAVEAPEESQVFGWWQDAQARDVGYPAGVLSNKGAFFTHVLLNDDLPNKARFLLSLIGKFEPGVWEQATARRLADFGKLGRFQSADEMRTVATQREASTQAMDQAVESHRQAIEAQKAKDYGKCLDLLAEAKAKLESAYYPLFPSKSPELRAVWCSVYASRNWQEMAKNLKDNGFNAVFPFVGSAGMAFFPNQSIPMSDGVRKGRDPLKECVQVAHESGIQVHVWFIAWYLHMASGETTKALKSANRPQLDAKGQTTNWLCPTRPENLAMVKSALLELVRNYDIDGIHFDYIRYPDQRYCFCDFCKQRFQKDSGIALTDFVKDVTTGQYKADFEAWRREQITRLVREVAEEGKAIKPNLKISAAVFGGFASARRSQAQDAADWADKGYVDFLCPMNYTNDLQKLEKLTSDQVKTVNGKLPIVAGIGVFSDSSYFDSPVMLVDQIDRVRQTGTQGFLLFKYNADMAKRFLPALRLGVTKTDATIPFK